MVKRKARDYAVERAGREGKFVRGPLSPSHVRQLLFGLQPLRALQHGRNDIEAGDVACAVREEAGDNAGAAGNIEHSVLQADASAVGHKCQQICIPPRVTLGEGLCLLGELIEDFSVMQVGGWLRGFHKQ